MSSQVEHTDVGAYALGLLEDEDRLAFEAHLRECERCRAELSEMAGMAHALSGLGPAMEAVKDVEREEPPPAEVIDLMRRRRERDRRSRRGTYVIGSVAAAALLATGVVVGSSTAGPSPVPAPDGHASHGPAQALVIWGERHAGRNAANGTSGVVGLESKAWGTHVGLELNGVRGPLKCRLEAVSRTGERTVVTGWRVPDKGYGVPGSATPLVTHGGTSIARADLSRFEVVVEGGGTLLTIPV